MKVAVSNLGGTPALNVTGGYEAIVCEAEDAPPVKRLFLVILPSTIEDGVQKITNPLIIEPRFENLPAPPYFYLHVRGFITYNDIFHAEANKAPFFFRRKCMRVKEADAVANMPWEEYPAEISSENHES